MLTGTKKLWCVSDGYAFNSTLGRMHRFLLNAPKGTQIDHINGDRLDNRRENLRFCTSAQNQMNRKKANGKSAFKGAVWQRKEVGGAWHARIVLGGKLTYLGTFPTDRDAAAAYNEAAALHFGAYASLNDLSLPASSVVSHSRKQINRGNPSGLKGVSYDKTRSKWTAQLARKGVTHLRKRFTTADEAARAYDAVAREVYGPSAVLNFY